jgi:hypothetical protein
MEARTVLVEALASEFPRENIDLTAVQEMMYSEAQWRAKALSCVEENLKLAQENDELRALVRRQLQWQQHRESVFIPMSMAESSWIEDAVKELAK